MNDDLAPIVLARKETAATDAVLRRLQALQTKVPSPSAPGQPPVAKPAAAGGVTVGGVVRDVAQGVVETATLNPDRNALLFGVASAIDEAFDTALDFALYPFDKSHADVDAVLDPIFGTVKLQGPQSTTGKVVSGITQFMAGMLPAAKALKAMGVPGGIGTAVVAGAAGDALALDEHQARVSDLVESVPALRNPVTEYLAGDPNDSIVEAKFKQALEGLGLGAATDGIYHGVKLLKRVRDERAAAAAATPEGQVEKAKAIDPDALAPELTDRDWMVLGGKPDAPLFEVTEQSRARTASLLKMAEERWGPDSVRGLVAEVRKPGKAPQGLMSWLRSKGGIKESGGELRSRDLIKRLPGLVSNEKGMALDDAALAATEAGYIGTPGAGRASIDDLLAALDKELGGTPVWSTADQEAIDRLGTVQQFGRQLDELGIDISAPDAEIEAALRARSTAPPAQTIDDALADNPDLATAQRTAADIDAENAAGALNVDDMPGRIKIGNRVGNINLNRIAGADDLLAVIRQTAEAIPIKETVRQSTDVAREMADKLLLDPDAVEKMIGGQSVRGQAFTREEIIATGELVTQTGKSIEKLARRITMGRASDAEKLALHRAVAFQGSVLNLVSGQAREAGRSLQAFQSIVSGNKAAAAALRDAMNQSGTTEAMAAALSSLSPQGQAAFAKQAASQGTPFRRGMEAIVEYWVAGILTGPRTHEVNAISNGLTAFGGVGERAVASRLGPGVAKGEAAEMMFGMMNSYPEALKAAVHGFKTGQPWADAATKTSMQRTAKLTAAHLGLNENSVAGRAIDALGEVQRVSFRALTGADEFFKVMARRAEIAAQAYRTATGEGLDGQALAERVAQLKASPTPEILAAANDYARYVTFQQPAGPITAKLQALAASHPLMRIPITFVQTPANIFKYAGERTPLALMSKKVRDEISAGGARRDLAWAKLATGSMIMATAADYATQGLITGAAPADPQLRQAQEREGILPYAANGVQYSRLDPVGFQIGLAADFSQVMRAWSDVEGLALPDVDLDEVRRSMREKGVPEAEIEKNVDRLSQETGLDPMKVGAAIVAAVQENVLNKSYMSGVSDIFEMVNAPSVDQKADAAERYAKQFLASLSPMSGLVRQTESIVDPNLRYADSLLDAWKSTIPGLSSTLPPMPDLWGEDRKHLNTSLSPLAVRERKDSPVDKEIVRLKAEITMPEKSVKNVRLEPREYVRFVQLAGRDIRDRSTGLNAKQYLDAVVTGNADATGKPDDRTVFLPGALPPVSTVARQYKEAADPVKVDIIKSIVSGFRSAARAQLLQEEHGLMSIIEGRERVKQERRQQ